MEATQQKPWSPVSWNNINTASAGKYSGHFVSSLCHTHTHQIYLKDNGNLHLLVGGERLGLCIWKVQLCSSHQLDSHPFRVSYRGGGGKLGFPPPKVQYSPPKNLRIIIEKSAQWWLILIMWTVHDRNKKVYRLIRLLISLNTSRT